MDWSSMIVESHAHYDDEAFADDREELLGKMQENGVGQIINVAASLQSCKSTLKLIDEYSFIYGALGVHPDEVGELNDETLGWIEAQCSHPKVVAVGEIGLDYYWNKEETAVQKLWFARQLELAERTGLPVIIHSREAARDTLEMMKQAYRKDISGVIHCYSYSKEIAREYTAMGYYLGIGGVATFKNAKKLKETIEETPLELLLLETDCPYLAPVPYRGKRNNSLYIPYIVAEIARIKGVPEEEVTAVTTENARRLFQLDEHSKAIAAT